MTTLLHGSPFTFHGPYTGTLLIPIPINIFLSLNTLPGGTVRFQASVLGKTWPENHLGLMHIGTS